MGSPKRDPEDPIQLAIAAHELGHAFAWQDSGLTVYRIEVTAEDGVTGVRVRHGDYDNTLRGYAIGLWAGFEAEDKWLKRQGLDGADRRGAEADIQAFKKAVRELGGGLSERKARDLARDLVNNRWGKIQRLAPELVRRGEISI